MKERYKYSLQFEWWIVKDVVKGSVKAMAENLGSKLVNVKMLFSL